MRRSYSHPRGERGVALLAALLVTALLTVIVMQFTFRSQVAYRRTASWVNAKQASLLAESGVSLAIQLLNFDSFADLSNPPAIDSLDEEWAGTLGPIDDGSGGTITLSIEDDSGRYDLNRLRSPTIEERGRAERLFEAADVDPALIGPIIDWLDADTNVFPVPEGAESDTYRSLPVPYNARNGPFRTFAELALVHGVTPADLIKLRRVAAVTPDDVKAVNINTASSPVLQAMIPRLDDEGLLRAVLAARSQAPFEKVSQIHKIDGMQGVGLGKWATVRSKYFRVRVTGGADGAYRSVEAMLRREDSQIRVLYWSQRRGPNIPKADSTLRGSLDDFGVFAHDRGLKPR